MILFRYSLSSCNGTSNKKRVDGLIDKTLCSERRVKSNVVGQEIAGPKTLSARAAHASAMGNDKMPGTHTDHWLQIYCYAAVPAKRCKDRMELGSEEVERMIDLIGYRGPP